MGAKGWTNQAKFSPIIVTIVVTCISLTDANEANRLTGPIAEAINVSCMVDKLSIFEDAIVHADIMKNISDQCASSGSTAITTTNQTHQPNSQGEVTTLPVYFNEYVFPWGILSASLSIACSVVVIVLFAMLKFLRSQTNSLLLVKALFDILTAIFIITGLVNLKSVFSHIRIPYF